MTHGRKSVVRTSASLAAALLLMAAASTATAANRSGNVATGNPRSASTVLCGDTNNDAKVGAGDALAALRASVAIVECMLAACDYNGDSKITAGDALAILRRSVGQNVTPGCPPASELEWGDGVWGQALWD